LNSQETTALIDNGASSCFIDRELAKKFGIQLILKPQASKVRVIDGRELPPILYETHPVLLQISSNAHSELISFNVIRSPHFPVILGMSWLQFHNPLINWGELSLAFPQPPDLPRVFHSEPSLHLDSVVSRPSDEAAAPETLQQESTALTNPSCSSVAQRALQHQRFGHRNYADLRKLERYELVTGIETELPPVHRHNVIKTLDCEACAMGKSRRTPFPRQRKPGEYDPLERICFDTCGPFPVNSLDGEKYFITFSDDSTRFKFTYLLREKSEAFSIFKQLKARIEKRTGMQIKILFGDNAAEYLSNEFQAFLAQEGITWQSTVPNSSEQNGISERGHLTIMNSARSMLLHARLPKQFWGPAVLTATHILNLCPHPRMPETTPHELLWGSKPDVSYLKVFGCDAFGLSHVRTKLDPTSQKYIFLGYASHQKGYVLYDPVSARLSVHRDVQFHESSFGDRTVDKALAQPPEPEHITDSDYEPDECSEPEAEKAVMTTKPVRIRRRPLLYGDPVSNNWIFSLADDLADETRFDLPPPPKKFLEANSDCFWRQAMEEELDALRDRETFEDVFCLPEGTRPISCVWVYKYKLLTETPTDNKWVIRTLPDGRMIRYKARLCVRGNQQLKGIDFHDTYAPVIRGEIVRLLIALLVEDSELVAEQMDAVTAFLNGNLSENIFMQSPQGYSSRARFVKLLKSLYGLRQAPHEWFKVIDNYLLSIGFTKIKSTTCLYLRRSGSRFVIVGLYVDDFPIIGHPELVMETKQALSRRFSMSDLGRLHEFIGVEIARLPQTDTAFIHQSKLIDSILKISGMERSRPYPTPAAAEVKLSKDMSPKSDADREYVRREQEHVSYRAIIGKLLYLRFTRPDILFALGQLCKFVSDPGPEHFKALKRLLRYLAGTRSFGILYRRNSAAGASSMQLDAFSDSDWAGDVDNRRSTTGFLFRINGNPISFSSKQQNTVALSSCEAETVAAGNAATECLWLRDLLSELGFAQPVPTVISQDNEGAVAFACNETNHSKMKHIALRQSFLRELVLDKVIKPHLVKTTQNLADIFTKPLGKVKFLAARENLNMISLACYENLFVERGNRISS
jgi:transposase InsO family protein